MQLKTLLGSALALLPLLVEGAPAPVTVAGPATIPTAFQKLNTSVQPLATTPYELTLHLRSPGLSSLQAKVASIAAADGQWLTEAELQQYIAPAASDKTAVENWLKANGIANYKFSTFGDRVTVQTTTGAAQNLFKAPLSPYSISGSTKIVHRATSYTIPADIAGAVEMVSPLTSFVRARSRASTPRKLGGSAAQAAASGRASTMGCNETVVTPTCIRNYYGSAGFTPVASPTETDLMIIGYDDQQFVESDLQQYLSIYRPDAVGYEPMQTFLGNGTSGPPAGVETMLDLEMISGLIYPLKSEFLLVAGLDGDEILESLQYVLDRTSPARPGTISISYGPDEEDVTPSQADQYQKVTLQLLALGTTVVFASGDNGVDGVQSSENLSCAKHINPPFPTTPAILLVGSTAGFTPEHATNINDDGGFWSGAGTSFLYPRPDYQQAAGSAYIASLPKQTLKYLNPAGRIISDVSAYGENLAIVYQGGLYTVGGTSASSPIFTSHLALVNSARRQKGLGRIGYVHPKFYASGESSGALKDITQGTTCGCPGNQSKLCLPCEPGFDPATGLGTPNFPKLLSLFRGN